VKDLTEGGMATLKDGKVVFDEARHLTGPAFPNGPVRAEMALAENGRVRPMTSELAFTLEPLLHRAQGELQKFAVDDDRLKAASGMIASAWQLIKAFDEGMPVDAVPSKLDQVRRMLAELAKLLRDGMISGEIPVNGGQEFMIVTGKTQWEGAALVSFLHRALSPTELEKRLGMKRPGSSILMPGNSGRKH
jgi:hypothetical protein